MKSSPLLGVSTTVVLFPCIQAPGLLRAADNSHLTHCGSTYLDGYSETCMDLTDLLGVLVNPICRFCGWFHCRSRGREDEWVLSSSSFSPSGSPPSHLSLVESQVLRGYRETNTPLPLHPPP